MNEITIQASLSVQRTPQNVLGADSVPVTPAGSRAATNQVSLTTSWTPIPLIDTSTNTGYLFVKNTDILNYVDLAFDSAGTIPFAKLRKNEVCLLPVKDNVTQIWGRASSGTISVIVVAAQA